MREQIRLRRYVMTTHAVDEMQDDDLGIFDVESVVLTGEIVERQVTVTRAKRSIWFGGRL